MINFNNIRTVLTFELKILFRSWFFRIFAMITLLMLFGINMGMFGFHDGIKWTHRAVAANIPYINVLFINVAQAIIAIFLASDFLRRDKKLDTSEVIYTRPVSNGEYVLGKTLAILVLFVGFVLLTLIMPLIFNLTRQDTPVEIRAYFYYPLLITIPTLIFILGLSFSLMIFIKNQAVTFIFLLAYVGFTLFYFQDKVHGLLDYMAFNLPLVYSDVIGFGSFTQVLWHRLAYLLTGIGFIFITIRFLNRLPQVGGWNFLNVLGGVVFLSSGIYFGFKYYMHYDLKDEQREKYIELNTKYASNPTVDVVSNNLTIKQKGRGITVKAEMQVKNTDSVAIDTIILSLNPGYRIDSILSSGKNMDYEKKHQLLLLKPDNLLKPNRRMRFTIYYSGIVDESIANLDVSKEDHVQLKKITVATIDKKPSISRRNFMLLTPEVLWYPVSGVGFNKVNYLNRDPDFTRFTMKVTPLKNLTAISTGKVRQDSISFRFTLENDLNALSLIIGEFERKTIKVNKTDLNVYIKPGHDFYTSFFNNIKDTIPAIIQEAIEDYEKDIDLYYAFKRINLVEVPVQYHVYDRPATQVMGTLMPEIIMLPEKGVGISTLDFSRAEKIIKKQDRKSKNERTPEAMELDIFKRFVIATFFRSGAETRSMSQSGRRRSEKIVNFDKIKYSKNPYCVFPLYYNYTAEISSKEYPLFNSMIELYFKEGFAASMRQSFSGGMTAIEKANLALKNSSMLDIFSQWDTELTSSLIKQTGGFILLALKNKVGASEFDNFLYYYVEDRAFSEISFQQFAADFYKEFEIDIKPYFEILNTTGKIPVYRMSEPEYVQTRDEIGEVYLISFKVSNMGTAKGLIDVTFRMGGRRGFGGGTTDEEQRIYELDAGVTKKVQVTLFEQPRMMTVNTLISANIPSTFNRFMRKPEKKRYVEVEEYEGVVDDPVMTGYRGEYIVDNEDEGFSYVSVSKESKIKKYIDSKKKKKTEVYYNNIFPYWSPNVWKAFAHSACYGDAIRSAMAVHSGDGSNTATWEQVLPEAGFYDLYVYIPKSAMYGRGEQDRGQQRGGQGGSGGGNQRGQQPKGPSFMDKGTEYHYTVSSNEGSEEVIYKLTDNTEEGWNKIGVFHFPADTVYVHLSNKTNKRRVIADAIKMVKK